MKKATLVLGASATLPFSGSAVAARVCGNLSIADMNWNSASLIAHIDQFILNHGCAELMPGDTMSTGTSMIGKVNRTLPPSFGATP